MPKKNGRQPKPEQDLFQVLDLNVGPGKSQTMPNTTDGPNPTKKAKKKRKFHGQNKPGGKGNWILKCDGSVRDANGETEADLVLKTLSLLHQERPEVFKYKPSAYKPYGRDAIYVMLYCSNHKDLDDVLMVAEEALKHIDFPYVMQFHRKQEPLYYYTPEKELYELVCSNSPYSFRFVLKLNVN